MARMVNFNKVSLMDYFKISKRTAELWKKKYDEIDFVSSFDYTAPAGETLDDFLKKIYLIVGYCPSVRDLTLKIQDYSFDFYILRDIVAYFCECYPEWLDYYHDKWIIKTSPLLSKVEALNKNKELNTDFRTWKENLDNSRKETLNQAFKILSDGFSKK